MRHGTDLVEEEQNELREVRREMKARWEKEEEEENVERLVADLP